MAPKSLRELIQRDRASKRHTPSESQRKQELMLNNVARVLLLVFFFLFNSVVFLLQGLLQSFLNEIFLYLV